MKIYNSLVNKKVDFIPTNSKKIGLYVCGPTVYDNLHIGNYRSILVFDLLYRLLINKYGIDNITYVRNITDIDDKILAKMAYGENIEDVTNKYIEKFKQDSNTLNCMVPNHQPKVTENIPEITSMINTLLNKGYAKYKKDSYGRISDIVFDTSKFKKYGTLSNRIDNLVNSESKNFSLWKVTHFSKFSWKLETPAVTVHGRPGWHIECSAMAKKYLGDTFDIHGGGSDLIFPHHDNEIAQSCCANGTSKLASYWVHNAHLQIDGRKMSKSLGNVLTLDDMLIKKSFGGKNWSVNTVRLSILRKKYRKLLDITPEYLQENEDLLNKMLNKIDGNDKGNFYDFVEILNDDLNVHLAITKLTKFSGATLKKCLDFIGIVVV